MLNVFSVLHILDSLPNKCIPTREVKQLQRILLKHFEGSEYERDRIATNLATVIFLFADNPIF